MHEIITSNPHWLEELAKAYKSRHSVQLIDDAKLGIDPMKQTIVEMGKHAKLGIQGWTAVVISVGIAATGTVLLVSAILDPEPFSKIGLALGAGAVLTMTGGLSAIRVLTETKPPNVTVTSTGLSIYWT